MTTTVPTTTPGAIHPDPQPLREPLRDAPRATPIDPAAFRATFNSIAPAPEEMKWASIPWQTDLWEARKIAQQVNKPIFMWSMNGNPLGCV